MLSPSLAAAAAETFGVPGVNDLFGMTEVLPVTGRTCSQRHLHHDVNTGHVEYLDLETGEPAAPGALATVVVTPYFPYRDCMPVFRYDTRDVVRLLPDEPLRARWPALPGTSPVAGQGRPTAAHRAAGGHPPATDRGDRGAAHPAVAGALPGRRGGRPDRPDPARGGRRRLRCGGGRRAISRIAGSTSISRSFRDEEAVRCARCAATCARRRSSTARP